MFILVTNGDQTATVNFTPCTKNVSCTTPLNTDELHKVINETNKLMKSMAPELKKSLALYLANEETEHILFRPCRVSVCMVAMFK